MKVSGKDKLMNETNVIVPEHLGFIVDGNRRWAKEHIGAGLRNMVCLAQKGTGAAMKC